MEYKILTDISVGDLQVKVNKLIMKKEEFEGGVMGDLEGWRPMGGVSVVYTGVNDEPIHFTQAMVKDD